MAPAVTAVLDRAIVSSRPYSADVFGDAPEFGAASNRAGSPSFGCRRSPQRQNFWQPQATTFNQPKVALRLTGAP